MRTQRVVGPGVIFFVLLFAGWLSTAQAANYLGDFCWQGEDFLLRAGVTDMGGGHFLLNGRGSGSAQVVESFVGNAEVVGSQVYMTITSTGANGSEMWGGLARAVLSLPSLNGTAEVIMIDHSKTSPDPTNAQVSYEGTVALIFVPCP